MKTSTRFSRNAGASALVAALTLAGGLAGARAAPADGGWNAAQPPPGPENRHCAHVIAAGQPPAAAPDWLGAAGNSAHLRAVLGGRDSADMDGMAGPCRLVDAEHDDGERINAGGDTAELLYQITELLEFDKDALTQEEAELLFQHRRALHLEVDAADHTLHAYIGAGIHKTDLGRVSERRWLRHWDGVRHGGPPLPRLGERRGELDQGGRAGAMAPVPEPSSYAMLLGGLGLLGALGWRRRARAAA